MHRHNKKSKKYNNNKAREGEGGGGVLHDISMLLEDPMEVKEKVLSVYKEVTKVTNQR